MSHLPVAKSHILIKQINMSLNENVNVKNDPDSDRIFPQYLWVNQLLTIYQGVHITYLKSIKHLTRVPIRTKPAAPPLSNIMKVLNVLTYLKIITFLSKIFNGRPFIVIFVAIFGQMTMNDLQIKKNKC